MHQAIAHELARQRDLPGAIASFRKAIAADPKLPGIHFELAEALHSSDDPKLKQQAEAEYKLAIAENSQDEKALTRLGDVTADKDHLDGAEAYYKRALALLPGDADAMIGLAHVYSEKNDDAAALPLLKQVVAADPTNILAHFRLAGVYRKLHQPEESRRELAEYQKYKDIKEKLAVVYKDMRIDSPQTDTGK
jgi:cytochrome c-type biogenesis protein CcmH/NrfG